jgi:hypothetical protein
MSERVSDIRKTVMHSELESVKEIFHAYFMAAGVMVGMPQENLGIFADLVPPK